MTELTPVEAKVQGIMMAEHRAQKCYRCKGRLDLSDGFVCQKGNNAKAELRKPVPCKKFKLDENQDNWLEDNVWTG